MSEMEWTLNGEKELKMNLQLLSSPRDMADDFCAYREEFGGDFSIRDYLKILDINAKLMIAKAIFDHPEFFADQFFKAFNSGQRMKVTLDGDINTYTEE